jgi:hypothetical protein
LRRFLSDTVSPVVAGSFHSRTDRSGASANTAHFHKIQLDCSILPHCHAGKVPILLHSLPSDHTPRQTMPQRHAKSSKRKKPSEQRRALIRTPIFHTNAVSSPVLRLPAEVRDQIYNILLCDVKAPGVALRSRKVDAMISTYKTGLAERAFQSQHQMYGRLPTWLLTSVQALQEGISRFANRSECSLGRTRKPCKVFSATTHLVPNLLQSVKIAPFSFTRVRKTGTGLVFRLHKSDIKWLSSLAAFFQEGNHLKNLHMKFNHPILQSEQEWSAVFDLAPISSLLSSLGHSRPSRSASEIFQTYTSVHRLSSASSMALLATSVTPCRSPRTPPS